VDRVARLALLPPAITPLFHDGKTGFLLAHYSLDSFEDLAEKTGQFGPGTEFVWRADSRYGPDYLAALRTRVAEMLEKRGMRLVNEARKGVASTNPEWRIPKSGAQAVGEGRRGR
jgi:hypothetical protein